MSWTVLHYQDDIHGAGPLYKRRSLTWYKLHSAVSRDSPLCPWLSPFKAGDNDEMCVTGTVSSQN